jgi:hypothetical protein
VTTLIVAFSVVVANSYLGSSSALEDRIAFQSITSAAIGAIQHGNSSVSVALDGSSVSCYVGNLSVKSPGYSGAVSLPTSCEFNFDNLSGVRQFVFSSSEGLLRLAVN